MLTYQPTFTFYMQTDQICVLLDHQHHSSTSISVFAHIQSIVIIITTPSMVPVHSSIFIIGICIYISNSNPATFFLPPFFWLPLLHIFIYHSTLGIILFFLQTQIHQSLPALFRPYFFFDTQHYNSQPRHYCRQTH